MRAIKMQIPFTHYVPDDRPLQRKWEDTFARMNVYRKGLKRRFDTARYGSIPPEEPVLNANNSTYCCVRIPR